MTTGGTTPRASRPSPRGPPGDFFTEWQQSGGDGQRGSAGCLDAGGSSGSGVRAITPRAHAAAAPLAIAGRYQAMGAVNEAGGDWYDIISLGRGDVALVIGDVVGHGAQAAPAMAQLRGVLRGFARTNGRRPAAVVGQLNDFAFATGLGEMTTLVYIALSVAAGTLRLTNAGHCPPLLLDSRGHTRFLEGGRSFPLGILNSGVQTEMTGDLDPGMTLLLYTDGLVEGRRRSLDDGLRPLRRATANGPRDLDELCDHVVRALCQGTVQHDDIALLAVRMHHSPGLD